LIGFGIKLSQQYKESSNLTKKKNKKKQVAF